MDSHRLYKKWNVSTFLYSEIPAYRQAGAFGRANFIMDDTEFLNNYFVSICYLKRI